MKNQNSFKKITKKFLFVSLLLLLSPCFAFGASSPIAASRVKANQPGTKLKKQIAPKNISKKMALKAAMKIRSITFKTNASGDWTFLYDSKNTGLATFAPHQLQYKSTQILTNGSHVPIHTETYNKSNAPGAKAGAHSPWNRCSKASKLMLEIIYQGKVLDKKIVNVPPVNVKINNLSSLKGKFKALLKNNTSYASKVSVRVVSKSPLKGGGSTNSLRAETIVVVPANSSKTCTGAITAKGKAINLEVLFRDEKKCSGKGYVALDRKALPATARPGLSKTAKVKALAGKVKVARNLRSGVTPPPPPPPVPGGLPNLFIRDVNITLLGNSQFFISYRVKNFGGLCERGFNVHFSKIGGSGDDVYVLPLGPNGIYDGNFTFSSQQQTTEIKMTVDPSNVIVESNEHDNQWTGIANNPVSSAAALGGQIQMGSTPTLVVPLANEDLPPYDLSLKAVFLTNDNRLKIRISNPGPAISQNMYNRLAIGVKVENNTMNYQLPLKRIAMTEVDPNGALRTAGNSGGWYNFTWPQASNANSNGIPLFNPGQSYRVTVFLGLIPSSGTGLYTEAPDSHPSNNIMIIRYDPAPDLVVCFTKQIHHNHTSRSYTYRPVVKNIGDTPSGPSILRFYIQGKGGKNYAIPSLKVNEEYPIKREIYWVVKGSRSFKLTVDKNGDVDESGGGELNNILKGKINVVVYTANPLPNMSPGQHMCSDAPGANN